VPSQSKYDIRTKGTDFAKAAIDINFGFSNLATKSIIESVSGKAVKNLKRLGEYEVPCHHFAPPLEYLWLHR
jgi:hypothetical protein